MKEIKSSMFATTLVFCGLIIGLLLSSNSTVAQRIAAITGNGTTGHLAKWVNSSGALGDSKVTEDKDGNISVAGGIKFPDGSVQTTASDTANNHIKQIETTLEPGSSLTIPIPRQNIPVRVEVSLTNIRAIGQVSRPIFLTGMALYDSNAQITVLKPYFDVNRVNVGPCRGFLDCDAVGFEIDDYVVLVVTVNLTADATLGGRIILNTIKTGTILPDGPMNVHINLWY